VCFRKRKEKYFIYTFEECLPFFKTQIIVQSYSVNLCNENRGVFFEKKNWNLKVKAVI